MFTTHLRRTVPCLALAFAVTLTGCQKEELLEKQFEPSINASPSEHGYAIEGQYIVVFKNHSSGMSAAASHDMSSTERASFKSLRERTVNEASIASANIVHNFDGVVNGFAAQLTSSQLESLKKNPDVAYIEQDRIVILNRGNNSDFSNNGKSPFKDIPTLGNGIDKDLSTGGNGKSDKPKGPKNNTSPAPAPKPEPLPSEPAPAEPTPSEPVLPVPTPEEPVAPVPTPTEPTPAEPAPPAPVTPAPSQPAGYQTIIPLAGENLPWNIERVGYGDGTGKTVWVIDSGIDTDHPDLNIDFDRSSSFIYGVASIEDGFGHGTSVAGIIAAKNNGSGMVGVASNASVVALRVFDNNGAGSISRAIAAVNYISTNAKAGDVVNISLGSGISSTLDNAVKAAASKGILFAIAAGNSAVDCSGTSPARVDANGVYTVSAIDTYNRLWASSNYGASVDFAAPGANVTVTSVGGGIASGGNGTSFAAPHVAGILLLRGTVYSQGTVTGDKDATPDPIASIK
ncbi:S8 family serine peptidase [uncultured Pontibacter sp.]|uniref:S8 family serine peptidase n=1 Tax=uncultured Pontibacter sp. TaxID=453356 RepID=UPI002607D1E3|nr:S8 family serine peptidase [uncultured Pontibacter sp.]